MAYKNPNYMKEYYIKNRDKLRKYQRDYYRSEKGREYYAETSEKRLKQTREYQQERREHYRELNKEYRTKNKERIRKIKILYSKKYKLKMNYGMSLVEYNELLIKQNNCCAICGRNKILFKHPLSVDHDHKTGKIRGLLCVNCNTMLGHIKDDPDLLYKGMEYLRKHNAME